MFKTCIDDSHAIFETRKNNQSVKDIQDTSIHDGTQKWKQGTQIP